MLSYGTADTVLNFPPAILYHILSILRVLFSLARGAAVCSLTEIDSLECFPLCDLIESSIGLPAAHITRELSRSS
jgi:hypothetical protein